MLAIACVLAKGKGDRCSHLGPPSLWRYPGKCPDMNIWTKCSQSLERLGPGPGHLNGRLETREGVHFKVSAAATLTLVSPTWGFCSLTATTTTDSDTWPRSRTGPAASAGRGAEPTAAWSSLMPLGSRNTGEPRRVHCPRHPHSEGCKEGRDSPRCLFMALHESWAEVRAILGPFPPFFLSFLGAQ